MPVKKDLEKEVEDLDNMSEIIAAYEEIAAMRMRRVKKSVLQSRDFMGGLNSLYRRIVFTYKKHLSRKKKRMQRFSPLLSTNGKTVSVLLSANTGLYGDIVIKTFNLFVKNIMNSPTDVVIIGRNGKTMFDAYGYDREYKFFSLSDTDPEPEKLKEILDYILQYSNVGVYHGIFRSVLNQEAIRTFVTGEVMELRGEDDSEALECIIEPSVDEVAKFFEKQILSALFEHTTYESSLSKYASRMVSLDLASENIREKRDKTNFKLLKVRHDMVNAKQLATLAGLALWDRSY